MLFCKRVIRIITNSRARDSCRELFKKLEILPLYSQYIFSLSIFVIKNKHLFSTNYQILGVHTRFKTNLHLPIANFTKFQKGVYYSGIKIFNNLPHSIKDLANETKLFWNALKRVLLSNSFYNSEQWRTQEFCSGGGSTNSVEDRENRDLEAVAP